MQRHYRNLTKLFAALLPACGGGDDASDAFEPDAAMIDQSLFTSNICDISKLPGLTPTVPVDSLESRTVVEIEGVPGPVMVNDQFGTRCSGASDMVACLAAVDAAPVVSQFVSIGEEGPTTYQSMLYTRRDEVGTILDMAQLGDFLGSLESPSDAALYASLGGARIVCDAVTNIGPHPEGHVLLTRMGDGCGEGNDIYHRVILVRADATIDELDRVLVQEADPGCAIGRLPAGLCRQARGHSVSPVGRYLAAAAELEAASVHAFVQLARELAAHGAPPSLVQAALTAARDEVRHARTMTRLARRWGGTPKAPVVAPQDVRPLLDIALDNAVEGCVRETFGAASAHLSARTASDRALRRAFATIAREETEHAALSWSLHEYFATRLAPAQRSRVARHRRDAGVRMEAELTAPLHDSVHVATGLPRPAEARRLYRGVITQRHQST